MFLITVTIFTNTMIAQKNSVSLIKWEIAAELPAVGGQAKPLGLSGPVSGVHHNVLLVAGGCNFPDSMPWLGGKKTYYDGLYVFDKKNGKVHLHPQTYKLPLPIAYAACCSTSQGVVYAGGENENGISNKVVLLQWDPPAENVITRNLPDLPVAVTNAAATAIGNTIYVAGGETAIAVSDQFYSLDLGNIATGWKQLPAIPKPVSHAVLSEQSNGDHPCIYLAGGRRKNSNGISDFYSSLFEFDLRKNAWTEKKSLPYKLSAGTGIAANSNYIVMFGGDKGTTFHKVEMLIAAVNREKDETKKQELILQKNKLQQEHPGFSREVLLYNTLTGSWEIIGHIPFDTPVTTTAVKWGNDIFVPGGEIKAGVRTSKILSVRIEKKAK